MTSSPLDFNKGAHAALKNPALQKALGKFQLGFPLLRARAMQSLPDFEAVRTMPPPSRTMRWIIWKNTPTSSPPRSRPAAARFTSAKPVRTPAARW